MNKLSLAATLALSTMWAVPALAAAPRQSAYTGFYYDAPNPGFIAELIEASLKKDASGNSKLDAVKCKKDGSCATPNNYLVSFQAHDPHGGWTLENLAAKLRTLVKNCDLPGVYQMDRISRVTGRTDVNGMSRTLDAKNGECAWVNPETGLPVLAQKCANPVGIRIDLDCVYIDFEVKDRREYSVIWARYRKPTDKCFAYRKTKELFERDTPQAPWLPVKPGCLGKPCDLSADNRYLGENDVAHGQIPLDQTGAWQIRLSPEELLLLCLKYKHEDGSVTSSFGNRTRWKMDYRFVNGAWHARVYYETDELKRDGKTLNGPGGLAFYASDAETEAQMQGITAQ